MEINLALQSIGLSEKETKIYIICLKLGPTTVNELSKETSISRTYIYDILRKLKQKGLIHYTLKEKKQTYKATNPEKLLEIIKEKQETMQQILPKLKDLIATQPQKPAVEYHEGIPGVNNIHDQILREEPKEILVLGNPEKHYEIMKFYLLRFVRTRVKKNIFARVIIKKSKIGKEWMKGKEKQELRETRFFPKDPKEFPAVTYIWNNKIAHFNVEKKIIGIVIENKNIARAQKEVFENLWKIAKKG